VALVSSIRLLDSHHDRAAFACSEPALTDYFRHLAGQQQGKNLTRVWVLSLLDDPSQCIGFYTLSVSSITSEEIAQEIRKRLASRREVPVCILGRLAVSREMAGQGWGAYLLADAWERFNRLEAGACGLLVEALHPSLIPFYQKFGFILSESPNSKKLLLARPRTKLA
jgi:GNAT superfamily N-acetyltransferase